ncbi:zinc finger MYND domain-containing protein 12 [Scleropages formosus]|uniref:Zinc finger, MYND-type containing 12 n=1 Tax=Scleropages formosus TaxID=113540 RepID=A0A8C9REZ7_SCLFO|nr:zinc finger MYND domain-containing protein 12 [Scleropages formosus]XP_018592095.2 zinc finger MYND domain-containing protein 12 [Scleropages formosus]
MVKMMKMAMMINPLALPKGQHKLCELCQKPAHVQCTKCRVTFYCNASHQQADWVGIHQKVCQLLVPLRTAVPFHALQVDRDHHSAQIRQRKEQLIEISRATAQRKLLEGLHMEALPAAQLCLRSAREVFGCSAVELVPAYLLLAEINIGLAYVAEAKEYLTQAEWTALRSPGCSRAVRHQLQRNLGRLYIAEENLEWALFHLANDVYYATEEFGLDSPKTCGGYLLMANVFFIQEKTDIAMSLYTKVASTWHDHLSEVLESHVHSSAAVEDLLDEIRWVEAEGTLHSLLEAQRQSTQEQPYLLALVSHALAVLCLLAGDLAQALEFGRKALSNSQLVPDCSLVEPIQGFLQLAEQRLGERDGSGAGVITDAGDEPSQ